MATQEHVVTRPVAPAWLPVAVLVGALAVGVVVVQLAHSWVEAFSVSPVGLLTGAALLAHRWWRLPVVAGGGLVVAATLTSVGAQGSTVLGMSLSTVLQAGIGVLVLARTGQRDGRAALRTQGDLAHWLAAGLAGPLVGVAALAGVFVADDRELAPSTLALLLVAAVLSQLLLVLPFLDVDRSPRPASEPERAAQWGAVLVSTVAVFLLQTDVAWAFVVVPLLAWGALRLRLREMVLQLLGLSTTVLALGAIGVGPFGLADTGDAVVEATQLLLFLLSGVLLVVPYALVAQQLRDRSAEAHRERELVGRIMASATRTAIIGTDRNGRITLFNVGAETLLGYTAEEMLGRTPDVLVPRAELQSQADAAGAAPQFVRIARALSRQTTEARDWRLRRKSGEVRTHSLTITPMSDERGATVGFVCTSEDVTSRVQRQDALLAALLTEREAVQRLEQADRMKDALVSTVSHELRTPLTSILGYATMLADGDFGDLPAPVGQTMERILNNGERLRSLVEDLLVLSRVNAGALELDARPTDVRDVVRSAYDVVAPSVDRRDLDVRLELPDDAAVVDGDAGMLERVVLNLLTNAVKFTPDGGRVDVSVKLEPDEVVLEVSDTGMGIPVEEQDQLFTQFFRSSLAKQEAVQGTGLGLSIARAIVDQHGGVIGATSEPGTGTTFLVVLPRLLAPAPAVEPGARRVDVVTPVDALDALDARG